MALDKFSNTGLSTLASGIDASQTTATLATGTGSRFPADTFNVIIWASSDFANPIDASDREIVRCTSRAGDVLTIVRGQEGTTGVAHNTAGKTYSVALIVSQKFRDDLQAGHQIDGNPNFLSGTSFAGIFDHANTATRTWTLPNDSSHVQLQVTPRYIYWVEDYLHAFADVSNSNAQADSDLRWFATTTGIGTSYTNSNNKEGVANLESGGAACDVVHANEAGAVFNTIIASKNPRIRFRYAQGNTGTGTRRIGVAAAALSADPANGIFIRHGNAGNMIAVCRAASVETTLDTLIASANGVFHEITFEVNGTTSVEVFVDGVSKDTISTNIPSVDMALRFGNTAAANTGILVDYFHVRQER